MLEKVRKTIVTHSLLEQGDRVIVALSGGADSTALLMTLVPIAQEMDLTLMVAHFNHGLRGRQSDADEAFCRDLAEKLHLPFFSGKMNRKNYKKGTSPEDFFRQQRYRYLSRLAKDHRAQKIALGHHLQDQAETVLMNLLRGSGSAGLKGILPRRDGKFIRPLLETSRQEIISFLDQSRAAYRQDRSNKSRRYLRNRVRADLIPYLKEHYNPNIEETLARTAEVLRMEGDFVRNCVDDAVRSSSVQRHQKRIVIQNNDLKKRPVAIRWRMIKMFLEELTPGNNGISFLHVKSVDRLVQGSVSGKRVVLPKRMEARREYDQLILEAKKVPARQKKYAYAVNIPQTVYVREKNLCVETKMVQNRHVDFTRQDRIYLDADKIKYPLVIRNRRNGDWFQPMGMTGRQKIKDYLINCKIPVDQRDSLMLLADDLSVISIENIHLNDRVKITEDTRKVLRLTIKSLSPPSGGSKGQHAQR